MTKFLFLVALLSSAEAFSSIPAFTAKSGPISSTTRFHDVSELLEDVANPTSVSEVWGYDGAMSETYASHFVIGNWLKSHKCGEGLKEDCPNELLNPGSVPAEVDVMAFLGVKRAEPVTTPDMKKA
ncbi:hypothetical protein TrCOL_g7145 [Triparma columacea]|uniref:Uncharacterized protein n=1 Tax=Triparma columacea TaxID=722753 RepID=A0A9W7LE14_9STRA|nr:hypothetical protein TrCOL_g7145 [Triparma columacea]